VDGLGRANDSDTSPVSVVPASEEAHMVLILLWLLGVPLGLILLLFLLGVGR
jgi:hypothetical protein